MTDHAHAATGPGPGSGPHPPPGAGPQDAAPAAAAPPAEKGEPRAPEHAGTGTRAGTDSGAGAHASSYPSEAAAAAALADEQLPARFRRDRRQKMLGGVCAGLGRTCDMDPVIFRITLAVLSATGGIGLIFYGFAWLFVPYEDDEENEVRKLLTGRVDGHALTAVLFALVGCGVFLTMLKNGGVLSFAVILSILLAGAGYWSRNRGAPDPDPLAAQAVADAPPEAQAPPVPSAYPSWWRDPIVKDGTHVGGTGYLWGPHDTRDRDISAAVNITHGNYGGLHPGIRASWPRQPKPRGPRWIGGWIFLLALLAGFLGTAVKWDEEALATSLQTGLACALIVFGVRYRGQRVPRPYRSGLDPPGDRHGGAAGGCGRTAQGRQHPLGAHAMDADRGGRRTAEIRPRYGRRHAGPDRAAPGQGADGDDGGRGGCGPDRVDRAEGRDGEGGHRGGRR